MKIKKIVIIFDKPMKFDFIDNFRTFLTYTLIAFAQIRQSIILVLYKNFLFTICFYFEKYFGIINLRRLNYVHSSNLFK